MRPPSMRWSSRWVALRRFHDRERGCRRVISLTTSSFDCYRMVHFTPKHSEPEKPPPGSTQPSALMALIRPLMV